MSEEKLDAILKLQLELSGQLHGLTIAIAHLFAIEARECPDGAADRTLGDMEGAIEAVERQLPDGPAELRASVISQLRRCLRMAANQVQLAKRQAPTSTSRN